MTDASLQTLRASIDAIDEQIIQLIGQRFKVVRKIKAVKQSTNTEVLDPQREAKVLLRLNELSHKYVVPLEVITHIYDFLMSESRKMQDR